MTKRLSVVTHVPVVITAESNKGLQQAVRELRHSGLAFEGMGSGDYSSFKIITKGVKLKDVRQQWDKVAMELKGQSDDADIFRPPRRTRTHKKKR